MTLEIPKKTAKHFFQNGDCRARDTNWAFPEYKPEVTVLEPVCLVPFKFVHLLFFFSLLRYNK
jgi:hypothetical protein